MKPTRRHTPLSVALLALAIGTAHAAPAWRFEELMRSAQATHPLISGKVYAEHAAEADQKGAEWQRYPTPSVEANAGGPNGKGSVVRLDQPLWAGGRIDSGIDAAARRVDAAGAAILEARRDLALRVIAGAAEATREQARRRHAESGVAAHDKLLQMIRRRVTQEVSPLADQRLAESRMYSASNDLSFANQALGSALAQLTQLAGQLVNGVDEASWEAAARPEGLPADLDHAIELALAQSPTLQRLAFEEEAADADIQGKRAAYMPQVSFRLQSTNGSYNENRAMLVLQAQPGAGLAAFSGVDAAIARREAARQTRASAQRDLRQQTALDWNEWTASRGRVDNAEQARATAAEVADSYARQYTAGRKTWLDVLNAVRENTQAELALDDARAQMRAAALRLKVETGVLNPDAGK
jgi:adhesin transport system outer membrane protein